MSILNNRFSTNQRLTQEKPALVIEPGSLCHRQLFMPKSSLANVHGGLRTKGYYKVDSEEIPLITVITAVHNGEQYLEQTVQSVINQTYDNVEFIVIDGGSTDATIDILRKFDTQINYWVSGIDNGIYDAFNKGVECAQGSWLCFIGADDYFSHPDVISHLVTQLNKNVDLVCAKMCLINKSEERIRVRGKAWSWKDIKKWQSITHVGMLHNFQLFKQIGLFNSEYKIAGDYEWILRLGSRANVIFVDQIIVIMRDGGVSTTNMVKVLKETFRIQYMHKEIGLIKATVNLMISISKMLIRSVY